MCSDLVVKCQEGDRRVYSLSRLGAETDDLESCSVDLLCELVHCNVTGSTHQDLTGGGGGGGGSLSKFPRTTCIILSVHCRVTATPPPSSRSFLFLSSPPSSLQGEEGSSFQLLYNYNNCKLHCVFLHSSPPFLPSSISPSTLPSSLLPLSLPSPSLPPPSLLPFSLL